MQLLPDVGVRRHGAPRPAHATKLRRQRARGSSLPALAARSLRRRRPARARRVVPGRGRSGRSACTTTRGCSSGSCSRCTACSLSEVSSRSATAAASHSSSALPRSTAARKFGFLSRRASSTHVRPSIDIRGRRDRAGRRSDYMRSNISRSGALARGASVRSAGWLAGRARCRPARRR